MQPDRIPLSETYRGRWREILLALGLPDKALVNRHGPCPVCGGKDRFRFDDMDGKGTFICSQCGAGDGPRLAMLFLGCDFKAMAEKVRAVTGSTTDNLSVIHSRQVGNSEAPPRGETSETKRARMNQLWGKALPIREGDHAGAYLARRLGRFPMGTGLRFHPSCQYPEGEAWPAMLAVFVGPDGMPSGMHRTYLGQNGEKAPVVSAKLSLGALVNGGAVRLGPAAPVMGIAEGIETALAASIMFGMPVWAALNANRLAAWQPPETAREVVVFADNDESFTGQLAAFDLEARLQGRFGLRIETPVTEGADWCDILQKWKTAA